MKGTFRSDRGAAPPTTRNASSPASPRDASSRGSRPAAKSGAAPVDRRVARAPHEIRIVGGTWRGRKLPVPDAPGLRPTPDRVRETLFNWLGQDLAGWRVLDAFAGTGALGLEAASRGATSVTLVESDRTLASGLQASVQKLQATNVTVLAADALTWMRRGGERFDLVLLDPPFDADLFAPALAAAAGRLDEGGFVYLEAPAEHDEAALAAAGWERFRHLRAGAVHAHLLRRRPPTAPTRTDEGTPT